MRINLDLTRDQVDGLELVTADLPSFLDRAADLVMWLGDMAIDNPPEAQAPGFGAALHLAGLAMQTVSDRDGMVLSHLDSLLRDEISHSIREEKS